MIRIRQAILSKRNNIENMLRNFNTFFQMSRVCQVILTPYLECREYVEKILYTFNINQKLSRKNKTQRLN